MLVTTGWVIVTGILHFDPALALDLPEDAFRFDLAFLRSLGEGSAEVLYLFLGYYQVCYPRRRKSRIRDGPFREPCCTPSSGWP